MKDFSFELLVLIAEHCTSSKDIASLCLVNHHFYSAVTRVLYKHVTISGPRQYIAFQTNKNSELKKFVWKLDFSSYTVRGSRYSVEKAKTIVMANELARLIRECEYLQELFVGEELMHAFVSPRVIRSIFCHKNYLRTLDFTGFCDRQFTTVMTDMFKPAILTKLGEKKSKWITTTVEETVMEDWSIPPRLENVSFYMCMALSQEHFFVPFFKKLTTSLRRLDLGYTQITSDIFTYMTQDTLTHLNLQGCHSLICCSPLISFIENCKGLVELNLNMNLHGLGGSRFCQSCIYRIMIWASQSKTLKSLDMGGHANLDDTMIQALNLNGSTFKELRQFSITYCSNISLNVLQNNFLIHTQLYYLNLARTPLTMDLNYLPRVLNQMSNHTTIKIIEISPFTPKKYPLQIKDWTLSVQGRRSYYSKEGVDPRYVFPKKMLMSNNGVLSPMNKYWCYSY